MVKEVYLATKSNKNNSFVTLDELPLHTVNAFLAAENSNYLENGSPCAKCIFVAVLNLLSSDWSKCDSALIILAANTSYSSLTQNSARRPRVLEMLLYSWRLENALGVEGVFELLLNEAYFGNKAFGISNAANIYFNKLAQELTIAESALLAGMLKGVSRFNPIRNPERAKERRDFVLSKMKQREMISANQLNFAIQEKLPITRR